MAIRSRHSSRGGNDLRLDCKGSKRAKQASKQQVETLIARNRYAARRLGSCFLDAVHTCTQHINETPARKGEQAWHAWHQRARCQRARLPGWSINRHACVCQDRGRCIGLAGRRYCRWFPGCPVPSISVGASLIQSRPHWERMRLSKCRRAALPDWRATVTTVYGTTWLTANGLLAACVGWDVDSPSTIGLGT